MTGWEALVLGLVQGLTEFLPISSSGHLVIGRALFGLERPDLVFDALVHGATMLAIVTYFRGRLAGFVRGRSPTYVGKLAVGTIPAVIVGLVFRGPIERAFGEPVLVVGTLAMTGTALLSLYRVPQERWQSRPEGREGPLRGGAAAEPTWWSAWWIGCAQAVAILPGVSRSGSTIVAGIWVGLVPAAAAEFSFLLGIPAIAGAVVLQSLDMGEPIRHGQGSEYVLGAMVAFASGLASIYLVFRLLARREFRWFGFYCWAVAIVFGLYLAGR